MSECIQIDPAYADALRRARLDTVARVMATAGDRLAAWSRTTDTVYCRPSSLPIGVYLKRYYYPRWGNRVRGMFRGTFLRSSRARNEYRTLSLMRELGIQGVRPIAYGERRVGHFLKDCFLMTEAVPDALSLATLIQTVGGRCRTQLAIRARREILTSLAVQVRHMHSAGFVHRDLFWRNVLIRLLPGDRFEFYFLDASVGKRIRMAHWRQDSIVRDIAAMGVLAPDFCTRSDQLRFLQVYLDKERLDAEDRRWLRAVQRQSAHYRSAEVLRLARGSVFDPLPWARGQAAPSGGAT